MEPMAIWWKIIEDWKLDNSITPGDGFPADGFVKDGTLVILKAGEGVNLFWADGRDMPCSAHVPNVPSTPESQPLVTFAGKNFSCVIQEFTSIPLDSTSQLTVKLAMSSKRFGGVTGNTGTFIAQAVPDPPPYGAPGQDEPGK